MSGDGGHRRSNEELFEMAQEEYERASRRLDEKGLSEAAAAAVVRRLHGLAEMITEPSLRTVVMGDAAELRAAVQTSPVGAGAGGAREPSSLVRAAQELVAWAWEDLPDVAARRARVQEAMRRIQRMPDLDDGAERREMAELQAQLVRLESALGAGTET